MNFLELTKKRYTTRKYIRTINCLPFGDNHPVYLKSNRKINMYI